MHLFVGSYIFLLSSVLLVRLLLCSYDFNKRCCCVVHTAVTDLYGVTVEDFSKFVAFWEVLVLTFC